MKNNSKKNNVKKNYDLADVILNSFNKLPYNVKKQAINQAIKFAPKLIKFAPKAIKMFAK